MKFRFYYLLILTCLTVFSVFAEDSLQAKIIAADQGDAVAQCNLGVMYSNGDGVNQDYSQASHYYKLAADQNYADAQFILGLMYYHGDGISEDKKQAAIYIEKAYHNGNEQAQDMWDKLELWKYKE